MSSEEETVMENFKHVGVDLPSTGATPATWLLECMNDARLEKLQCCFFPDGESHYHKARRRTYSFRGVGLTEDQFASAVCAILGDRNVWQQAVYLHSRYSQHTEERFDEVIDSEDSGTGSVTQLLFWEQLIDAFLEEPPESIWTPLENLQIFRTKHCKREPIVKVIPVETPRSFYYVVTSRWGRVGLYDATFQILDQYRLESGPATIPAKVSLNGITKENSHASRDCAGDSETTADRKRGLPWVNDVVFLSDVLALMFFFSDSSLQVWSVEWLVHRRLWTIMSLPKTPRCATYKPSDSKASNACLASAQSHLYLGLGDNEGSVIAITFVQPRTSLFRPKDTDNKKDKFFWMELQSQTQWIHITTEQLHASPLDNLQYFPDGDVVISTSRDPEASLVLFWPTERKSKAVLKLAQGATCACASRARQLLVSGSRDGSLHVWPLPPSIAPTRLPGNSPTAFRGAAIRDLRFAGNFLLSLDDDGVLKLWNLQGEKSKQRLELPVAELKSQAISSIPHTPYRLFPGPARRPAPASVEDGVQHLSALITADDSLNERKFENVEKSHQATGAGSTATSDGSRVENPLASSWAEIPLDIGISCGSGVILIPFCPPPKPPPLLPVAHEGSGARAFEEGDEGPNIALHSHTLLGPPPPHPQTEYPTSLCATHDQQWDLAEQISAENSATKGICAAEPASLKVLEVDVDESQLSTLPEDLINLLKATEASIKRNSGERNSRSSHLSNTSKTSEMKRLVRECAPHMTLRLASEVPLRFSRKLPVSTRMLERKVDVSDPKRLVTTRLLSAQSTDKVGHHSTLSPVIDAAFQESAFLGLTKTLSPQDSCEETFDKFCRGSKFNDTEKK